jgi:capsular polysaccharide biosynthesis protein
MAAADSTGSERKASANSRRSGFHASHLERPLFRIDLRRSLRQYRGLALGIAISGIIAAVAYWMAFWPVYSAETRVYVQPAPVVQTVQGVTMHWPYNYDPATYDSYVQQQMLSMTRADVLQNALNKFPGFKKSGESDERAIQRLRESLEVGRIGNSYEVSIKGLARGAQMAADIANAVAASYLDNTTLAQKAIDAERMRALRAEADGVKNMLQARRAEQAGARAAQNAEQSTQLSGEMTRLQRRYDALDAEIQDLSIDDAAPGTAHVAMTAVPPASPVADGVVPNAVILAAAFLLLAVLAAVLARKLNPRVYVAADVEQVLGFGPIVELPDLGEVQEEILEEQLLRLSAAVNSAIGKENPQPCVFTGAGSGTGVTTIATRVRKLMEDMGRSAVLVHSDGKEPAMWPDSAEEKPARPGGLLPPMLIERPTHEAAVREGAVDLVDAAPLTISAETELLVRKAACVVAVVKSGVTTRAELRATSRALQRLEATQVGYVLNRVELAHADPGFRESLARMEAHAAQRRKADEERVRTRKIQAQPAVVTQQQAPEPVRMTETTPEPAGPVAATEALRRFAAMRQEPPASAPQVMPPPARGRMEGVPRPQMKVSTAARDEASQSESQVALPWWLADASQNPEAAVLRREEQTPAESAEPPAEPQASRLSGLRKLFINRNVDALAAATRQESGGATGDVPVSDLLRRETAEAGETPTRRGTPMVTAVPEFLPPRKTGETKRDPDAASRRDRRDTLDDVSVLPSWRGQYRRKE